MKKFMWKIIEGIVILLIFSSMFGCTLSENVEIEVCYPPTVADTIFIPSWDTPPPTPPEIGN